MKTYPRDDYDSFEYGNIDIHDNYNDSEYCKWLEKLAAKLITNDKYIMFCDLEEKIEGLGIEELEHVENLHMRIEDKDIRDNNPLLKDYPAPLVEVSPEEHARAINEWEIHVVAELAQDILDETAYKVRSNDYKRLLKKLEPYEDYFLIQTWNKLSEYNISRYFSVRLDESIPWSETNEHPDNIVYDLKYLIWANRKEERYLSIDADINSGIFASLRDLV